jgi:acyl-CoA thioesterase-1
VPLLPIMISRSPLSWSLVRVVLWVVVVIVACVACNRTSPEQPRTPPEPTTLQSAAPAKPSTPTDTRPIIVAFGDSLTAGFGAETGNSYPDFLQKELDRRGLHWRVVNAGVSGDTTTDGVNRVGEVLAYKPSIVILEFGGNDGLRGLPLETTRANLEQMIVDLQKGGVRVVLAGMTLPPNYGPEYIRPFERIYFNLATKYEIPRIRFLLEGVGGNSKLMQRDGLHATAEGNVVVAKNVFKTLEPLLQYR